MARWINQHFCMNSKTYLSVKAEQFPIHFAWEAFVKSFSFPSRCSHLLLINIWSNTIVDCLLEFSEWYVCASSCCQLVVPWCGRDRERQQAGERKGGEKRGREGARLQMAVFCDTMGGRERVRESKEIVRERERERGPTRLQKIDRESCSVNKQWEGIVQFYGKCGG